MINHKIWEVVMANAKSTSNEYSDKLRESITEYLKNEGWRVGAPRIEKGVHWILVANDEQGRHINVIFPATALRQSGQLVIANVLKLGDKHKEKYIQLDDNKKRDLIYELRRQILLLGVGYDGIGEPLEKVIFEDILYVEDLNKSSFLQSIRKVRNASLLAVTIIAQRFNEPPPTEPQKPTMGFIKSGE